MFLAVGLVEAIGAGVAEITGSALAGSVATGAVNTAGAAAEGALLNKAKSSILGDSFESDAKLFIKYQAGLISSEEYFNAKKQGPLGHTEQDYENLELKELQMETNIRQLESMLKHCECPKYEAPEPEQLGNTGTQHFKFKFEGSESDSRSISDSLGTILRPNTGPVSRNTVYTSTDVDMADHLKDLGIPKISQVINNKGLVIDPKRKGQDLGKFIALGAIDHATSNRTPEQSTIYVASNHPDVNYVIPVLLEQNVANTLPTSQRYMDIKKIYNGRSIKVENVNEETLAGGDVGFWMFNEVQLVQYWRTSHNKHFVVQPIHGTWTGINSPNNTKPIDLMDTFSMLHDIDYKERGSFDSDADLKLISRCSQNMDRMSPRQRLVAAVAIKYFSTIGSVVASIFGPGLDASVTKQIHDSKTKTDIFPLLVPEAVGQANYNELRYHFYQGMMEGIIQTNVQSGYTGTGGMVQRFAASRSYAEIF